MPLTMRVQRFTARCTLALAVAALHPASAAAQDSLPATMLRVLAEAVDGIRSGRSVYVVASRQYPYVVLGAYENRAEAARIARDSGRAYALFGPYVTHRDPSTARWQVLSITVRVRTPRGEEAIEYDPRQVDALFLSLSAVDKFMVPYYTRVYGPQVADSLRSLIAAAPRPPCHMYTSFSCWPLPPLRIPIPPMR